MHLCHLLFAESARYANAHDGNVSPYSLAGVPVLFSALRALLIECNSGMFGKPPGDSEAALQKLDGRNEVEFIRERYGLSREVMEHLALLYEVRNEIVHPAHRPAGTRSNTPAYMEPLRRLGVLQSTGAESAADYTWSAQLQSHRLFRWANEQIAHVAATVIDAHHANAELAQMHKATYFRFNAPDA